MPCVTGLARLSDMATGRTVHRVLDVPDRAERSSARYRAIAVIAPGAWWDIVNPDLPLDADTQRWWARYLRVGASPSMARDLMLMNAQIDVRSLLPDIHAPTLVLHRDHDRWVEVNSKLELTRRAAQLGI